MRSEATKLIRKRKRSESEPRKYRATEYREADRRELVEKNHEVMTVRC